MTKSHPTVLTVEDEPITRFYEIEVAENAGFLTLPAGDAAEALRELEGPLDIDVLLTDIDMPGPIDGLELVNLVRRKWPEIGIVIATGNIEPEELEPEENAVVLAKPFEPDQLVSALRSSV